jgi:alpha-galactosidase
MIPAMVDIARDVLDLCPEALFFNYGNPMTPVCRAVRQATGAEIVGLCHGVNHVSHELAAELGVDYSRFSYSAVGLNHLTWFTEVRVDGHDAMPQLREVAARKLAQHPVASALGEKFAEAGTADGGEDLTPFSWQLLLLFNAFPACRDRHVMEFFPHCFSGQRSYFGKTPGLEAYSLEATIASGDRIYQEMGQLATSKEPLSRSYFSRSSGEHEQVTEIIRNLRDGVAKVYSANLPNTGQVPNLPLGAVLESPAVTTPAGLRPIAQPPLSPGLVGTLATRLAWVETVVEAALEGSRDKFLQALLLDGAVPSLDVAAQLADELLAAQAHYLPQFS